jgi:hypothetical protein
LHLAPGALPALPAILHVDFRVRLDHPNHGPLRSWTRSHIHGICNCAWSGDSEADCGK